MVISGIIRSLVEEIWEKLEIGRTDGRSLLDFFQLHPSEGGMEKFKLSLVNNDSKILC